MKNTMNRRNYVLNTNQNTIHDFLSCPSCKSSTYQWCNGQRCSDCETELYIVKLIQIILVKFRVIDK